MVQHWKHGWIPISPEAKAFKAGKGPNPTAPSGPDRSHPLEVVRATAANNAAINREMTEQGIPIDHPIRGALNRRYGNTFIVARENGKIVGGITLDRRYGDVEINEVRVLNTSQRGGYGQQMIAQAAKLVAPGGEMKVHGAVDSAKPFYAKTGATFLPGSSFGVWSDQSVAAMKVGKKPEPGKAYSDEEYFAEELQRIKVTYPAYYREQYGDLSPQEIARKRIRRSSGPSVVVAR